MKVTVTVWDVGVPATHPLPVTVVAFAVMVIGVVSDCSTTCSELDTPSALERL